jgi:hypothetical protein
MVASAARVELNRSDLCKGIRSCSIISVPGSAVTKRARYRVGYTSVEGVSVWQIAMLVGADIALTVFSASDIF